MKRIGLIVVGAGPAGLSAAIEAAKRGVDVVVFDENARPGGQLFKQIHKFFGSKEHRAKVRGFRIGKQLLEEADAAGVQVVLDATVIGVYLDKEVVVRIGDGIEHYKADAIIIATGAAENMVPFPGPDHDEPPRCPSWTEGPHARFRQRRTCRQLPAEAGRL